MKKNSSSPEIRALAKHMHMSAHRARRVINQIRGRSYEQALMILELMPYRACYPIFQLIHSAAANANHNMGLNKANLFVSRAEVNEGAVLKDFNLEPKDVVIRYKNLLVISLLYWKKDPSRSNSLIMPIES
uniref:50S ribosomal protein L22, chloroplastic n=1 Tax=Ginkgo biloba TaxID=3311 RepID=H9A9B6_GINBI|nr:ribosomal protein L22 [Ginkgo biloba]AEX98460.1 ribosomal protein L22 [Ginkgo biloba]AEX98877.1 ribosomal protein L22 [Ginkgo biloba]AEX99045.1 ribosomal protein L22 [Ginkgo biloba]